MTRTLEVAVAAGGTAGHINPALALAEELSARGHHVTFYGQSHKLEGTLVPEAGYDFFPIRVTGFDRTRPWTVLSALWRMLAARRVLNRRFGDTAAPDVAVGFGAYVEMPLLSWCSQHNVPYVIHEQNSVPGLANKLYAHGSLSVCVSQPHARTAFEGRLGPKTSVVVTGNPVRGQVIHASRAQGRADFGIAEHETMLLVFGGSLGARHLNQAIAGLKDELLSREGIRIVHSTGQELFDEVESSLGLSEEQRTRWQLMPYIRNMGGALAAADLVVSRAGASSIAEIAALAVPSILVPYPLATGDHQTTNARYLADAGASTLVADDDLDAPVFTDALLGLLDHADRLTTMRAKARGLAQDRAAVALADQVELAVGA